MYDSTITPTCTHVHAVHSITYLPVYTYIHYNRGTLKLCTIQITTIHFFMSMQNQQHRIPRLALISVPIVLFPVRANCTVAIPIC